MINQLIFILSFIFLLSIIFTQLEKRENFETDFVFEKFIKDNNRKYKNDDEKTLRYNIFKNNMQIIKTHNEGKHSYKLGITKFMDWTDEEYKSILYSKNTYKKQIKYNDPNLDTLTNFSNIPSTLNWATTKNPLNVICVNSTIRDQGKCGCCWAMTLISLVENSVFRNTINKLSIMPTMLSVQQIIDCTSANPPNEFMPSNGCIESFPYRALETYFRRSIILCTEQQNPYKLLNTTGKTYTYPGCNIPSICTYQIPKLQSYTFLGLKQTYMKKILTRYGAYVIVFDGAGDEDFKLYKGGIYNKPIVNRKTVHSLLLVGWDKTITNEEYWICKNSWGTTFGDPENPGYVWFPIDTSEYGYANISEEILVAKVFRPCYTQDASVYISQSKVYYDSKPSSNISIKLKAFVPDITYNLKLTMTCIGNSSLEIIKKYIDANNNLIDSSGNIVANDMKYYFKDENGTTKINNNSMDRWFIYTLDINYSGLIFGDKWDLSLEIFQNDNSICNTNYTIDWWLKAFIQYNYSKLYITSFVIPITNILIFVDGIQNSTIQSITKLTQTVINLPLSTTRNHTITLYTLTSSGNIQISNTCNSR